ncbi:MAG: thioredoxin-like domain-containing protein [Leptospirales bacterium]
MLAVLTTPAWSESIPSLQGGDGWLNSAPLTRASLSGKVVLVDFWEYTCVNCVRTFPVLKRWDRTYGPKGLVIIGIHTPEFTFGQLQSNVASAVTRFGLHYPVVLDNRMILWNRFRNHYWPAEYLYGRNGELLYHSIGEGDYDEMEARIRLALDLSEKNSGSQEVQDFPLEMTHELYAGSERGTLPVGVKAGSSGNPGNPGKRERFNDGKLVQDQFNPRGEWEIFGEYITPGSLSAAIRPELLLPYHAAGVHLVLRPLPGEANRVDIALDGHSVPRSVAGKDIRYDSHGKSYILVRQARMYDLTNHQSLGAYLLDLVPTGRGPAIYAATFDPH